MTIKITNLTTKEQKEFESQAVETILNRMDGASKEDAFFSNLKKFKPDQLFLHNALKFTIWANYKCEFFNDSVDYNAYENYKHNEIDQDFLLDLIMKVNTQELPLTTIGNYKGKDIALTFDILTYILKHTKNHNLDIIEVAILWNHLKSTT